MLRREDWFKEVLADGPWELSPGPVPGAGHQRSRLATHPVRHIRVYMKPGFPNPDIPPYFLALERIAAHLAYILEMNVPPVQLGCHPQDSKTAVCFSLEAGPVRYDWRKVEADSPSGIQAKAYRLIPQFAPTIALDIWIQALDRKEEHLLYAEDEEGRSLGIYSLDYSLSMIYNPSWQHETFDDPYTGHVQSLCSKLSREPVLEGVKRIQALNWRDIQGIVEEIPKPFLKDPERNLVLKGLKERQKMVDKLVKEWMNKVGL